MPSSPDPLPHSPDSAPPQPSYRHLYFFLFLIGFVLRFGFVLWRKTYVPSPYSPNPFSVEVCSIAAHLARGQGFSSPFMKDTGPTAWVAPVYPFLVSIVFKFFGIYSKTSALIILCFQCILAAATGVTIHALGRRTLGEQVAFYTAWIWTLSPFFFRWPTSWIWDFAASAFLLTAVFILTLDLAESATHRRWLLFGAMWALIALTNPALLSLLPFTFAYVIYTIHRQHRAWLASFLLSTTLFAALLSPWLIRNDLVFGHPVFLRSNFWFEFHLGNYHFSNGMGFAGLHPSANPREMKKYSDWGEQQYISWTKQQSLSFVHQDTREFLDLTLHRVLWFWDGTPLIYQSGEWWQPWEFWPLSVTGLLGLLFLLTRRPRGWLLISSAILIYPFPYYLTYSVSKYRHAIEPLLLLLSVYLAQVLYQEIRPRKS